MNYAVFKLVFKTAYHVGNDLGSATLASAEMTINSDTLFSALCIEALQLGGEEYLKKLYKKCLDDELVFSSLFPYLGEDYFLPKPILHIENTLNKEEDLKKSKEYKNLKYISAIDFKQYLGSLQGTDEFDVASGNEKLKKIGVSEVRQWVSIKGEVESVPYHVATFNFFDNAGLYFITAYKDEQDLDFLSQLLNALAWSGIGGKRSAGLGKFILDDPIFLDTPYSEGLEALSELLSLSNSTYKILLNLALPQNNELDKVCQDSSYMLIRRGGFVQSENHWHHQIKKKLIYAFAAGSSFKHSFSGDIYDVSISGNHPVYKYLKPLFMGVDL